MAGLVSTSYVTHAVGTDANGDSFHFQWPSEAHFTDGTLPLGGGPVAGSLTRNFVFVVAPGVCSLTTWTTLVG